MKLSQRQEKFALNLFSGMTQREAWGKAGYSTKYSPAFIDSNACNMAKTIKIQTRLAELRNQVSNDKVMSVQERKERLSEIARGRLTDYQESGLDGSGYISITKESPNTAAIQSIESATKFDENGNTGTLFTKVRLHNPVQAIQELNKLDRLYTDSTTVNVDNRKLTIIVNSQKSKELTELITQGEGTCD